MPTPPKYSYMIILGRGRELVQGEISIIMCQDRFVRKGAMLPDGGAMLPDGYITSIGT